MGSLSKLTFFSSSLPAPRAPPPPPALAATATLLANPFLVAGDLNDGAYIPAISDVDIPFNYLGTPAERAARGYTPPANVMPDTPWVDASGRDWSFFGWKGRQPDSGDSGAAATQAAADQPAPSSASLPDFPCKDQAAWGKCGEWWMAGKCDRSCGRCDAADGACVDVRPSGARD